MIYRKILVPLDGSTLAESILPYARRLAIALRIPVEMVQIIDPEVFRLHLEPSPGQYYESEAERRRNSVAYLTGVMETFLSATTVDFSVEVGNPAEVIADKAAADSGTLIAMTTHVRSGFQRWLLGSVAHKVAHIATNPLLLVRGAEGFKVTGETELKTVLVPLDGSELAELALPHAAELAKELLLKVVLVRVYDPLAYGHLPRMDQIAEELRAEAEAYLEAKVRQLEAEGIETMSYLALKGYPAAEIVEIVQRMPHSLVAISTHGRTGIKKWFLGSVAERVVHYAGGPVLIIRAA